ncbi:MAG: glycoside hydrolase family 44 protein [Chthoniobacterales bacterium]
MKFHLIGSVAILLSLWTTPAEASGLVLYDDALRNGWEDYSWATANFNATTPARGAKSIRVEAEAYEALYFHHAALDASAYESFSFWLHLGTTSFAPGSVAAQVVLENGSEGPAVALTAQNFPSDTASWKKAVIPLSSLGIPAGSRVTGFYIRNYTNTTLPTFYVDDVALLETSTSTGALSLTTVTSDNGLPARSVQWKDAAGKPRRAVMVNQRAAGAGYLRQLTYQIAGVERVCRGTGVNGHQGNGYVQNHTAYGGDSSSHQTPGTTAVLLAGPHHAIISYDMPGYKISGKTVPTRVQWFFANGRSHPIFAISQDARALAGNLGADSRSPYGDVDYTGGAGAPAGGASFGDTYKFATLAGNPERVTRASGWRYNQPNTIPYAMQWSDPAQVDAEMGHVATLPIKLRDQGSDTRTFPAVDRRGTQDLDGPLIHDESWAYQILNYVLPASGPTWSRRLTWGTNWGLPGGFDNYGNNALNIRQYSQHSTSENGAFNGVRANGMLMAYSVFVVLGPHTGGYLDGTVGQAVKQMENAAAARFRSTVGTVVTNGPAGIGNAEGVTIPYKPAGYNPTYSTWDITAAGNAVTATLTPAAGKPLNRPIFVVHNYKLERLPKTIAVGDGLTKAGVDYFATLDAATQRLWITVNRLITSPMRLRVTPPGAASGDPDNFAAGEVDVVTTIHTDDERRPISPLIYGINTVRPTALPADLLRCVTLIRRGGDRSNAYNWETNVSNSGIEHGVVNDMYLAEGLANPNAPAALDLALLKANRAGGRATMVPFVLNDYVAGLVASDIPYKNPGGWDRDFYFRKLEPVKPTPFSATPNLDDGFVYTDEHIHYLQSRFADDIYGPGPTRLIIGTDNEPDLYAYNFPMLQTGGGEPLYATNGVQIGNRVTGTEFTQRFVRFAKRAKAIAPAATIVGPDHYNFDGWTTWNGSMDEYGPQGRWYMDDFLATVREASALAGKRLLDTWDFHWYPQRVFNGIPTWNSNHATRQMTPAEISAVVQGPRSYWDPTYDEQSWITVDHLLGPAYIVTRLKERLADGYPGTKLGVTEYFPGGRAHISSGLATADSLGVFGRMSVHIAALWPAADGNEYAFGAIKLLRNANGNDLRFAATSVRVDHPEKAPSSVYAGSDSAARVTVLAINKTNAIRRFGLRAFHEQQLTAVDIYRIDTANPDPQLVQSLALSRYNAHAYSAPPMSAAMLVFRTSGAGSE